MLDVHPPHEPTHTWKDFFIHIATIVVGLLIAIGLEQTVERIHEHYELRETREALADERVANRELMARDQQEWLEVYRQLRSNLETLTYLRSHPGTKQADLPAELDWTQGPFLSRHAVWDAAEQNGVVHHMPLEEANRYQDLYEQLRGITAQSLATWDAMNDAARYDLLDPDPTHLSAAELDEEIRLARTALEKHFEMGYSLGRIANAFRDMPRAVNYSPVLDHLRPTAFDLDPTGMKAAHDRLAAKIKGSAEGTAIHPGQ